ncbi:MAG TPA: hypothetical protein VKH37_03255, partial [Ferruginibacter sp.]|nr:hypothetical protein [Ferruginibacter sp.]
MPVVQPSSGFNHKTTTTWTATRCKFSLTLYHAWPSCNSSSRLYHKMQQILEHTPNATNFAVS